MPMLSKGPASFYGAAGAGCLIFARDTGRFLFAKRSKHVKQPFTYSGIGGAIDTGENPAGAVEREVYEEAGYDGELELVPLYVFMKGTFRYYNFLGVVEKEFAPEPNWETILFRWCEWGDFPHPLHFGMVFLLNDPKSVAIMQKYATKAKHANH